MGCNAVKPRPSQYRFNARTVLPGPHWLGDSYSTNAEFGASSYRPTEARITSRVVGANVKPNLGLNSLYVRSPETFCQFACPGASTGRPPPVVASVVKKLLHGSPTGYANPWRQ